MNGTEEEIGPSLGTLIFRASQVPIGESGYQGQMSEPCFRQDADAGASRSPVPIVSIFGVGRRRRPRSRPISLEPVREHIESSESFVIQGKRPDLIWGVVDVDEQAIRGRYDRSRLRLSEQSDRRGMGAC